jgi:archaemetzincin
LDKPCIIFFTVGTFDEPCLDRLGKHLEDTYQLAVTRFSSNLDLEQFYDATRRQYNANQMLQHLNAIEEYKADYKLLLVQVDIFIPILTYIFGQAVYKGKAGVISLFRLRNEQYGLKPDSNLLTKRFWKVISHEIGHMLGLVHCHMPTCVMRSSTYVEDIDQKHIQLCVHCLEKIAPPK